MMKKSMLKNAVKKIVKKSLDFNRQHH